MSLRLCVAVQRCFHATPVLWTVPDTSIDKRHSQDYATGSR
jgi:hypothetical protein